MLSWTEFKCYVDWKGCDRELSRPISSNMRIRTDDWGWCHDLIWGDMCIGSDDIWCCLDQIYIDTSIGKDVTGSFHDFFVVVCGIEQMIDDDAMT
jgi:hypothetical protein